MPKRRASLSPTAGIRLEPPIRSTAVTSGSRERLVEAEVEGAEQRLEHGPEVLALELLEDDDPAPDEADARLLALGEHDLLRFDFLHERVAVALAEVLRDGEDRLVAARLDLRPREGPQEGGVVAQEVELGPGAHLGEHPRRDLPPALPGHVAAEGHEQALVDQPAVHVAPGFDAS